MTDPAPPFDAGNPFPPDGPSNMETATLPDADGVLRQMLVTIRKPGATLTVVLDKANGERWAANIAEAAALLAAPDGQRASANGHGHAHG